jgi:(S)-ureidoglycine aminohydrolase
MDMSNILGLLIFVLSITVAHAQVPLVESKMYSWREPDKKVKGDLFEAEIFNGVAHDFAVLAMSANRLKVSSKSTHLAVPKNIEYLLLVKGGNFDIIVNDSTWSLNKGSIALLMPGQKFEIQNKSGSDADFYIMMYRSKLTPSAQHGYSNGGAIVMRWDEIPFRPHDRGGIRSYFERPTSMSRRFEMHVTTLNEGIKSHEPHTHRAEEIVLVLENKTEMQIGEKFFKGGEGDVYFLGSNVPHAIRNDGKGTCTYFAFQFE